MGVSVIYLRQLEGIVDLMIDAGNDPKEIIDCCKDAIIESLLARNKSIPDGVKS